MRRSSLLPAAYLLDRIAGDPEWFPHPVRLIGLAIAGGETILRGPRQREAEQFIAGAGLTLAVVASAYWGAAATIRWAHRQSSPIGDATELLLGWTCLAARNLEQEANAVLGALDAGALPLARVRLARIVGRDTGSLDEAEIRRAVIETVAESASDGILAPLVYMAIGGVPLAMAYKAVNTLDSMIGHADARYYWFGKAAARLDDVANFIPARLTALAIVAAALLPGEGDARAAWRVWLRDRSLHKSPNAGQPESAMAGALGVRLGGENSYGGERLATPTIGDEFPAPTAREAGRAIRLVAVASLLGLAVAMLLARRTERSR